MPPVSVYIRFVGDGFKWPLRPGDCLELWSHSHELVGQLDASLLLDMLANHLRTAKMVEALRRVVALDAITYERMTLAVPTLSGVVAPLPAPRKALTKITPERRAERRARRRSRKGRVG